METWMWIAIVAAAVLVVFGFVLAVSRARSRARTESLRETFGPEYERTAEELGNRRSAEAELEARLERRAGLEIRPLDEERQIAYRETWQEIQARFVEAPSAAVGSANGLVVDVMRERGYPIEDFDQRAADISVDHPEVVENYRAAREIGERMDQGLADTEDLRRAMVHVGALLDELLAAAPEPVAADAAEPAVAAAPKPVDAAEPAVAAAPEPVVAPAVEPGDVATAPPRSSVP
jgi:hypothetical protein